MKPKIKFKFLNMTQRINVIKDSHDGLTQRKLATKYNCSKTQIQNILAKKDEIQFDWKKRGIKFIPKRIKNEKYTEINKEIMKWYEGATKQGFPVTGVQIQGKALEIAQEMGRTEFKASNGWLRQMKRRSQLADKQHDNSEHNLEPILKSLIDDYLPIEEIILKDPIENTESIEIINDSDSDDDDNDKVEEILSDDYKTINVKKLFKSMQIHKEIAIKLSNRKLLGLVTEIMDEYQKILIDKM